MKSNIKYADILIVALGIAYMIIGIMNLFGIIQAKIILLCSIVSFVIAIVQIMDTIASGLRIIKINIIKTSVCMLEAWHQTNKNSNIKLRQQKITEYKTDWETIGATYESIIKLICYISNGVLTGAMVFFLVGLSTDFIKGNAIVADTLTLLSFAIVFFSIVLQTHMDKYIEKMNQNIKNTLDIMGE